MPSYHLRTPLRGCSHEQHLPNLITIMLSLLAVATAVLIPMVSCQLADTTDYPIGPLTSYQEKAAKKVCDVTDVWNTCNTTQSDRSKLTSTQYGAVANSTKDLGPPLKAAFNACSDGGVVNIPSGTWYVH